MSIFFNLFGGNESSSDDENIEMPSTEEIDSQFIQVIHDNAQDINDPKYANWSAERKWMFVVSNKKRKEADVDEIINQLDSYPSKWKVGFYTKLATALHGNTMSWVKKLFHNIWNIFRNFFNIFYQRKRKHLKLLLH